MFLKRFFMKRFLMERFYPNQPPTAVGWEGTLTLDKRGRYAIAGFSPNSVGDILYSASLVADGTPAEIWAIIDVVDASDADQDEVDITILYGREGAETTPDTTWHNLGPAGATSMFSSSDGNLPSGEDAPWADVRLNGPATAPWDVTRLVRSGNLRHLLSWMIDPDDEQEFSGQFIGRDPTSPTAPRIVGGSYINEVFGYNIIGTDLAGEVAFNLTPNSPGTTLSIGPGDAPYLAIGEKVEDLIVHPNLSLGAQADGLFEKYNGVLLLGPECPITSTTWTTAKGQVATIAGGFRQIRGWWPGTTMLVTLPTSQSYIANPGAEVDATGWSTYNVTASQFSDDAKEGSKCFKLTFDADGTASFTISDTVTPLVGERWSGSLWAKVRDPALVGKNSSMSLYEVGGTEPSLPTSVGVRLTMDWQKYAVEHDVIESDRTWMRVHFWSSMDAGSEIFIDCATGGPFPASADIVGSLDGCTWEGAAGASESNSVRTTVSIPDVYLANGQSQMTVLAHASPLVSFAQRSEGQTFWDMVGSDPYSTHYRCRLNDGIISVELNGLTLVSYVVPLEEQWFRSDRLQVAVTHNFIAGEHTLFLYGKRVARSTLQTGAPSGLTSWYFGMDAQSLVDSSLGLYEHALLHSVVPERDLLTMFLRGRPMLDRSALYV